MDLSTLVEPWHWLVLGLAMIGFEIFMPGVLIMWFGVAGVATGLILIVLPLDIAQQALLFGVLSLLCIFPIRRVTKRMYPSDSPEAGQLNQFGAGMVGRHASLSEAVVNGSGAIHFGDSRWAVRADTDLPIGATVVIRAVNGSVLHVEPVVDAEPKQPADGDAGS